MRTFPFLGNGISFPFRIDGRDGDIKEARGNIDSMSVAMEFIRESWTIREPLNYESNLIADSVVNIILTDLNEHDTLPWYGSRVDHILFEPNSLHVFDGLSYWFANATKRWENRVIIDEDTGVAWFATPMMVDEGRVHLTITPIFVDGQKTGNLVTPFVSSREVRTAEYKYGNGDDYGRDATSRYRSYRIYSESEVLFSRPRITPHFRPRPDDIYYKVALLDTWLLISYKVYNDIRYWWGIIDSYIQDKALNGESRSSMNQLGDPVQGDVIRIPSRTRMLLEVAT